MRLTDHSRIAIIGGGPAGSLAGYFLLELADRIGLRVDVDIYEPRDFSRTGPPGCNMCAGVVSESLVQTLATEGINLPPMVVQRGIDAYILHTSDLPPVAIATPSQDLRIATVYRGSGPRVSPEGVVWSSFDGFLLKIACQRGAHHLPYRVTGLSWDQDRPRVTCKGRADQTYDLLLGAVGINTQSLQFFEDLAFGYQPPPMKKGFLAEIYLGVEQTQRYLGSNLHIFLLDIPGLKFAALIPKVENVTVCLLGENINKEIIQRFMTSEEVRACFPPDWQWHEGVCRCQPKLNLGLAQRPYHHRVAMIGDCAISRLYKDGIGAAYTMAKACAVTSIFFGVAATDFENHYWPTCKEIARDNRIGLWIFAITAWYQKTRFLRYGMVRMIQQEQLMPPESRAMSRVLWDTFTGSATYLDIFMRTLHPIFGMRLVSATLFSFGKILWERLTRRG